MQTPAVGYGLHAYFISRNITSLMHGYVTVAIKGHYWDTHVWAAKRGACKRSVTSAYTVYACGQRLQDRVFVWCHYRSEIVLFPQRRRGASCVCRPFWLLLLAAKCRTFIVVFGRRHLSFAAYDVTPPPPTFMRALKRAVGGIYWCHFQLPHWGVTALSKTESDRKLVA